MVKATTLNISVVIEWGKPLQEKTAQPIFDSRTV